MLFKQGDVAAKLEKKSELYKTFPHFYKMKIPTNHPYPYRNRKVGGVHQMNQSSLLLELDNSPSGSFSSSTICVMRLMLLL